MKRAGQTSLSLWLGVLALFGLLISAWVVFFMLADRHPVQEVPRVERGRP
jgi:hypothetical protein